MPTNSLTDAKIRAIKAGERAAKHFDGGGLHLYVAPTGAKVWRVAYRFNGKPKTMSLGPYPDVGLAAARAKRDEAKARLRDGDDPMQERRDQAMQVQVEAAQAAVAAKTLRVATDTYWDGRKDLSASYVENAKRGIEMHLYPKLGDRPVGSITRDDLLAELNRMDAKGLHVYVRKVRMWVGQVFDWAIEQGFATSNPAASINTKKAFGRAEVEHFPALELTEVPDLMQRLTLERELQSVLACRMLALTWVRTNELRMMEWTEVDGDLWRIPKGKMKKRRDHLVPLSRQAVELLAKLKLRSRESKYVFPAEHRDDRPMSENTVLALLARLGYKGKMTGHGWRTVASTWANEAGMNKDAIERQLAHVPDDKVRAAYNRAEFMPERRSMLQAWADWLDSCHVDAGRAQG